jgi:hypothetical protein
MNSVNNFLEHKYPQDLLHKTITSVYFWCINFVTNFYGLFMYMDVYVYVYVYVLKEDCVFMYPSMARVIFYSLKYTKLLRHIVSVSSEQFSNDIITGG